MKTKFVSLLLAIVCFVFVDSTFSQSEAQQNSHRNVEPQLVTLLSQNKHNNFAKSNFNFKLGVRGDSSSPRTGNNYDLSYGGIIDDDKDWFNVPVDNRSFSQIIDIGAANWTDIYDISLLSAKPIPHTGGTTYIFEIGKVAKIKPENSKVKIIVGHIYLLHAKENNSDGEVSKDLYAMFRVEALKSNDEVTISWKIVPSPENQ